MKFRLDVNDAKQRIFLHILKGTCTEREARQEIKRNKMDVKELIAKSEKLYVFSFAIGLHTPFVMIYYYDTLFI